MKVFGLENYAGHLNCFLNVNIQAFWNIIPLNRAILKSLNDMPRGQPLSKLDPII